jgi:hypothetical protein
MVIATNLTSICCVYKVEFQYSPHNQASEKPVLLCMACIPVRGYTFVFLILAEMLMNLQAKDGVLVYCLNSMFRYSPV